MGDDEPKKEEPEMLRTRGVTVFAAAVLSIAVLGGCGSSGKASTDTTTTVARNSDFDISTPQGSASLSLNGKLPPNWPSGFPIPNGAKVAGSGSLGSSSRGVMVAVYTVTGTASATFTFYKDNSALTVTESRNLGVDGEFGGNVQFSGTYSGSATVASRNSTTYLVVVLQSSGGATTTTSAA